MKWTYAALCILGVAVPYYFFVPYVLAHGLDVGAILRDLFVNPVSSFFAADVIVSTVALWAFIVYERRRRPVRWWWLPIVASLLVGVSLALPLFLLLRQIENDAPASFRHS